MGLRPIFMRWWFWVGFAVLLAGAIYLRGYFEWRGEQAGKDAQNVLTYVYSQYLQNESKRLEEAYRNDPYGGETPEETLRLYVEALEKEDYELAARHFVFEEQKGELEDVSKSVEGGGLLAFAKAYRTGKVKFTEYDSGDMYEVDVVPPGEEIGYFLRFRLNPFTGKWKLTDH